MSVNLTDLFSLNICVLSARCISRSVIFPGPLPCSADRGAEGEWRGEEAERRGFSRTFRMLGQGTLAREPS